MTSAADLLTLTIGGNDVGFADLLEYCAGFDFGTGSNCPTSTESVDEFGGRTVQEYVDALFASVGAKLDAVLGQLVQRAPDATVVLIGYPHIFADERPTCPYPWEESTINWFTTLTDQLNGIVQNAAASAGVHFVDPRAAFDSHEVCGGGDDFFQVFTFDGPFHPNAAGHALGYGRAINDHLTAEVRRGTALHSTGLPVNPPAVATATATATEPAGPLPSLVSASLSLPGAPADVCTDHVPVDTSVELTAAGFAPGSTVTVGSGYDNVQIGTAQADANGFVTATVTTGPTDGDLATWWLSGVDQDGVGHHGIATIPVNGTTYDTCDVSGPTITLESPVPGTQLEPGSVVPVTYRCEDPSGVTACAGTPSNGSLLDTTLPGYRTITVLAVDTHGNPTERTWTFAVGKPLLDEVVETATVTATADLSIEYLISDGSDGGCDGGGGGGGETSSLSSQTQDDTTTTSCTGGGSGPPPDTPNPNGASSLLQVGGTAWGDPASGYATRWITLLDYPLAGLPADARILEARLTVEARKKTDTVTVAGRPIATAWDEGSTVVPALGQAVGPATLVKPNTDTTIDVTDAVHEWWVDGGHGVAVTYVDGTDYGMVEFYSREKPAFQTTLVVTYATADTSP